jgi:putative PIN family toxin of toxin-antitoxin system
MSANSTAGKRPRATLDTNQFVSGVLFPRSLPSRVLAAWEQDLFVLVLSHPLYTEIATVLARPRFREQYGLDQRTLVALLHRLANSVEMAAPAPSLPIAVRDPKDEHVLATAIGGSVDFLVTGDADLLVLANDAALGSLRIVAPRAFLVALGQEIDER